MSERVAIVVGAGGELGRATAEKLAAAGYTVVGVDRNEEGLKELSDGIRREAGDPTDPAAARSVIDRIAAEVGPPEVLVNTIGTFRLGEALAATPEDLRLMMEVNLGAALWLSQAVEPYMRERGTGSIVHVSARPGRSRPPAWPPTALSKAALVHLIRMLDLELRPLGIRVNAVAPQLLDTAKNRPYLTPDLLAHAVEPEAVANIIAYLAGEARRTGQRRDRARLRRLSIPLGRRSGKTYCWSRACRGDPPWSLPPGPGPPTLRSFRPFRWPGGVVSRPGLFERLDQAQRVVQVSAPPGSGKTFLLRSWIAESGLAACAAWVSVPGGCDSQRFWISVADALRDTAAGSTLVRPLTAAPDLDGWAIVERLLEDLALARGPGLAGDRRPARAALGRGAAPAGAAADARAAAAAVRARHPA